jgi:integrase
MALTQKDCDRDYSRHTFKNNQLFVRCDKLRGFALRVTENGAKSFTLDYSVSGKSKRKTIGQYPVMSLPQAYADALRMKGEIARDGAPAPEPEVRPTIVLEDLCERYMRDYSRPHKRERESHRDQRRIERHFAKLARKPIDDISVAEVVALHQSIADNHGPIEANRAMQLLRSIYNTAQGWELTTHNPVKVRMFKETKRDRFLSPEELLRVNDALVNDADWRWRAYFPLLLLLGLRKMELLGAKWTDVNEAARTISIAETKSGRPHILPLPAGALDILATLPSRGTSPWLFPSELSGTGHLEDPWPAWQRIRQAAGVPDVRIHDLRRTFGSWLAAGGFSLPVIGRTLNHSNPSSTAIYARLQLDPVRQAMEANAEAMLSKRSETV